MGTGTPLYGDRAPTIGQYVVIAGSDLLDNERILTGTSNQIVVTDNGAGSTVVLSTPQNIHTGASPTFVTVKLSGLTDGYIPYHVADATGLANSPVFTDGTDVGIGTPAPATPLHISKAGGAAIRLSDSLNYVTIESAERAGGSDLILTASNDAEYLRILHSSGNVGIGTAAPESALTVVSTSAPQYTLRNLDGNVRMDFIRKDTSSTNQLLFGYGATPTLEYQVGSLGTTRLHIRVIGDSVKGMVLTDAGLFGMGLVVPVAKLHVDQTSTTAAIPVLFLDQGDVSEQCIELSSDGADRDVHLFTVDVTGTPAMDWLETPDIFSLNKGLELTAGALSLNTLTLTAEGPATALDVSGVNVIFIDTTDNDVGLSGTINGVDGQVLHVVVHDATNTTTIFDAAATGNQDFYLHAGGDEVMDEKGGWSFVNMGGDHWHDISHAKHVAQ